MRCKWDSYPKIQTVYPDSIPAIPHGYHCWLLNPIEPHLNPTEIQWKNMNISLAHKFLPDSNWLLGCLHLVVQNGAQGAPRLLHRLYLCIDTNPTTLYRKCLEAWTTWGKHHQHHPRHTCLSLYTQNRLQIVHHTTKSGTKKYTIGLVCIYIPSEYT